MTETIATVDQNCWSVFLANDFW